MNAMTESGLLPAWNDPVHDAQATFRTVLKALAEPGLSHTLPVAVTAPTPLSLSSAALLLTLADLETSVWLAPVLNTLQVCEWLRFHCGCRLVADKADAQFAVISMPEPDLRLETFAQGCMEYPDQSATLLVQVPSFTAGPARVLSGPGIPATRLLHVAGLPPDFHQQWQENFVSFPRGVDMVFCCGDAMIGLPRTTRIQSEQPECM
jgi:alpha-D-ribose 1-methylphosphonate 5-triphosphate synthase subunit PhnH